MSLAPQQNTKTVSEIRNVAVSFSGKLDSGELLTGTPTVVEANPSSPQDLTFSNIAINTGILTINDIPTPVGEAVQFKVSGGVAGRYYEIIISCGTDATPAQTLYGTIRLRMKADSK